MSWTRTSGSHALLSSRAQAARLALSFTWKSPLVLYKFSKAICLIRWYKQKICEDNVYVLWLQVPQDVLQKLLETLQENHYQEDEQFLGAVMPRLGNYRMILSALPYRNLEYANNALQLWWFFLFVFFILKAYVLPYIKYLQSRNLQFGIWLVIGLFISSGPGYQFRHNKVSWQHNFIYPAATFFMIFFCRGYCVLLYHTYCTSKN